MKDVSSEIDEAESLIAHLADDYAQRLERGERPDVEEYVARWPGDPRVVRQVLASMKWVQLSPLADLGAPSAEASATSQRTETPADVPFTLGRYQVTGFLGQGGFGVVYRGHDPTLRREVAIKVPHRERVATPADVEEYLAEARLLAKLNHSSIVPVFDCGKTDDGLCYIVSQYMPDGDLARVIAHRRPSADEAAELVASVAEGLHHAHQLGLVHRDIKPANILIDRQGHPLVADFGMALTDESFGRRAGTFGTPAYMSPEQARGEGHRVDARSDVYSLGVVFYELLAGRRPYRHSALGELLDEMSSGDVRPPRQLDHSIPKELERICLKALAKRAADRYTTAHDLAEDLRHYLARRDSRPRPTARGRRKAERAPFRQPSPETLPAKIVPKGLRSFDAHDADFFLQLLPGATDRDGLPESIRFWKTRVEISDADQTFSVGLVYGPSGCGKSSLVKAGLLPRLSTHVLPVFLEATVDDTEARLLRALRKVVDTMNAPCAAPADGADLGGLTETIAALRRGLASQKAVGRSTSPGAPATAKVLIVLDQFEQWLHGHRDPETADLVRALRQCDGARVQCLVLVRDDFWMAASRFMQALEIPLIEGQNSASVDLFDRRHARRVLTLFGRALGCLPNVRRGGASEAGETHQTETVDVGGDFSSEQNEFLDRTVADLAEEGKVVSVRLALFAEMVKGQPWTAATLKQIGGISGVGVTFLEETLSAAGAPPPHRLHQQAARAVLKALLPEAGSDIKGHRRTREELLLASGYSRQPGRFAELLRLLDSELRLVTPADDGVEALGGAGGPHPESQIENPKSYQLTHDYLVASLRVWLTRKQCETHGGRAELRLAQCAAAYAAQPGRRRLPGWWEWADSLMFTQWWSWTPGERRVMRAATRRYVTSTCVQLGMLLALALAGYDFHGRLQARAAVDSLTHADVYSLRPVFEQVDAYRHWATPTLEALATAAPSNADGRRARLHARLALVSRDERPIEALVQELLAGPPEYVEIVRERLAPYRPRIEPHLWQLLHNSRQEPPRRFRAALALADYDASSDQWTSGDYAFVAEQLLTANAERQPRWRACLRPIAARLLDELERLFADQSLGEARRMAAANALADFALRDATRLARLLTVATPEQFQTLYPPLKETPDPAALDLLARMAGELPTNDLSQDQRVALGQRRASAAIALLRHGERERALSALRVGDDPESLTQFIHRCRARGVSCAELLACLPSDQAPRPTAGRAPTADERVLFGLLSALGEFDLTDVPESRREELLVRLTDWYAHDQRSGIHGAAGWLLRHWNQQGPANEVDQTPRAYSPDCEWFTLRIEPDGAASPAAIKPPCITFVIFPAASAFIGSPPDEIDRQVDERRHRVRLPRDMALSDREITWSQFDAFDGGAHRAAWQKKLGRAPASDEPVSGVDWSLATSYCDWLARHTSAGNSFRLPTEAEWELACRAGTTSAYSFGNDRDLLRHYAWYFNNSAKSAHPVGRLRPNPRGLFDMHGNLFEWCHDGFAEYADDTVDHTGNLPGPAKVYRGGGWGYDAANCRSANRVRFLPELRDAGLGFRVAFVGSITAADADKTR